MISKQIVREPMLCAGDTEQRVADDSKQCPGLIRHQSTPSPGANSGPTPAPPRRRRPRTGRPNIGRAPHWPAGATQGRAPTRYIGLRRLRKGERDPRQMFAGVRPSSCGRRDDDDVDGASQRRSPGAAASEAWSCPRRRGARGMSDGAVASTARSSER